VYVPFDFFLLIFFFVLHRMSDVISLIVPILEALAIRCALLSLLYLCEVAEDGSVLAGVELELPVEPAAAVPRRMFFWSVVCPGCLDAYDEAAMQAIRFLQRMYGFVVRDCNYDCMVVYRDSMCSAVVVAGCAARHAARLEREPSRPLLSASAAPGPLMGQPRARMPLDWHLLCSRLLSTTCYI
jgi:hypothetical protein